MPDICGSTTPIANAAATAASTALPPALSMAAPASLAYGLADETIPRSETSRLPVSGAGVSVTPTRDAGAHARARRAARMTGLIVLPPCPAQDRAFDPS